MTYLYSTTGYRLSKVGAGQATGTYSYAPGTHHLVATGAYPRAVDAAGNTTGSMVAGETFGFAYNDRNRLGLVQRSGATVGTYSYNVQGERVAKQVGTVGTQFAYDEASQLVGEAGADGFRDYVRLGDLPVAVVDSPAVGMTPAEVHYIHADALGSPRVVTDQAAAPVWRWSYAGNPFGEQAPTGVFDLQMRFAGQYHDAENRLDYNVQRYYESILGRYTTPDPLGLPAGPSLHAYVGGNPLSFIDPLGLTQWQGTMTGAGAAVGIGGSFYRFVLDSECKNGKKTHVIVDAVGPTFGPNVKGTLPGGLTSSSVTLNDELDDVNPDVLNGWFMMYSAGASMFRGYSASMIQLGGNGRGLQKPINSGAFSGPSFGSERGIELGAGVTAGSSTVMESSSTSCGCGN